MRSNVFRQPQPRQQFHFPAKQLLQKVNHREKTLKRLPAFLKIHEQIHVALRPGLVAHKRAEQSQLRYAQRPQLLALLLQTLDNFGLGANWFHQAGYRTKDAQDTAASVLAFPRPAAVAAAAAVAGVSRGRVQGPDRPLKPFWSSPGSYAGQKRPFGASLGTGEAGEAAGGLVGSLLRCLGVKA